MKLYVWSIIIIIIINIIIIIITIIIILQTLESMFVQRQLWFRKPGIQNITEINTIIKRTSLNESANIYKNALYICVCNLPGVLIRNQSSIANKIRWAWVLHKRIIKPPMCDEGSSEVGLEAISPQVDIDWIKRSVQRHGYYD